MMVYVCKCLCVFVELIHSLLKYTFTVQTDAFKCYFVCISIA